MNVQMSLPGTLRRHPWLIVPAAAALWGVLLVLQRFLFELQGTLNDDVYAYLTVSRGILNGLTPYVDLFESKPPGIFLLGVLSIVFFKGPFLLKLLEAASVLTIPLCTFFLAQPRIRDLEEPQRTLWLLASVVAGSVFTLYTFAMSGEGLVESLGAALCLVAAVLFDRAPLHRERWRIALLSFLFLCVIGLKEPFVLVLLAIALLLMRSRRHLITFFVVPLVIASAVGLIALLVLGYLGPYFSVYLVHMFGYHLGQLSDANGSFFVRGLLIQRTLLNFFDFSQAFALAVTFIVLGNILASVKRSLRALGMLLVALYLLFLAVGTGGDFYGHHFVFAVPGFVVLFALLINQQRIIGWITILLLLVATIFHVHVNYREKGEWWKERKAVLTRAAETIDGVMDRCGWERYLHVVNKGAGAFGYTKHSPYGPIFIQFNRFIEGSETYEKRFREALFETPLLVLCEGQETNLTDSAKVYINENFSFTPPSCAGAFQQPVPYRLVFRKPAETK